MSLPHYRGLTWDHPRGYRALEAAARDVAPGQGLTIQWDRHSLEGFESAPIADLAERYDLIVLDHPHVGEAVAQNCLLPMENLFGEKPLADLETAAIGRSLASYHYAGAHWALPLDAATQVMAYAHNRIDTPPTTWGGVIDLAARQPVALSLAGPHAILSFQSIVAALGGIRPEHGFVDRQIGRDAYAIMTALTGATSRTFVHANPIALLQAMAAGEDIALTPLVYGYVNYAIGGRVGFADAPRGTAGIGSILGGTGIAVSKRCIVTPALETHLSWLMGEEAQRQFIPAQEGQPSLHAAWTDAQVDADWGGFYSSTHATLEAASLRPRHDGAIAFQTQAAIRLRDGLIDRDPVDAVLDDIEAAFRRHHSKGAEL
ncbi:carbohydrate ABC transporter substrate-binding protein [Sphingobium sp.]|uniref:carbohydrate ABC transporter substrate-binding protein n=1 Tax=Sphingobium sp. TaxID=1912891 RepID=UPI00260CEDEA|nr:carbohydrate ABC transporter substrate-binding protein [Sphingobium sp.]